VTTIDHAAAYRKEDVKYEISLLDQFRLVAVSSMNHLLVLRNGVAVGLIEDYRRCESRERSTDGSHGHSVMTQGEVSDGSQKLSCY
jgi:hypothetical protein